MTIRANIPRMLWVMAVTLISLSTWGAKLKVSENKRFLVYEDNKPFFYLGDTAWELFHRLGREDADRYLQVRADQGYTVIQAVVLAELNGLQDPNPYGHTPLKNGDPTQLNEDYFRHVDYIVGKAEKLGLFIGMLPTWGDKVGPKAWGVGPEVFTKENAAVYGELLGKRYKDRQIIWILGGDRTSDDPKHQAIWRAMAQGLRKAVGKNQLMTYHPPGGQNSSKWYHNEEWLDFNMWQNGHCDDVMVWERIQSDYNREPIKPVMDGEPLYEDHPICFKPKEQGYSNAADVRRFLYLNLFSGAFGHTYGNHSVWQMHAPGRKGVNGPLSFWYEAIERQGAVQMRYGKDLVLSRPFMTRIPDQTLIVSDPGSGAKRIQATRDSERTYAMIYAAASRTFTLDLEKLKGEKLRVWWFNPRTGDAKGMPEMERKGKHDFTPPDAGENIDWVLVLDDAAKNYPAPGKAK
ncbi:MAG TPA: glycoside hydrolase family 140 protein [Methylomirabilota bacterium]|nr:glycoside hydrolase family 140 protein [Methylomirabilota bacterium]